MFSKELMFPEKLQFDDLPDDGPSPQLWSRIAQVHRTRAVRRRRLRIAGAASCVLAVAALAFALPHAPRSTDWQARAQALEIELHTYPAHALADPITLEAESGLMQVDVALQAAYDRGAQSSDLGALWKQRSELLSTLLAVRQRSAAVTRI